MQVVAARGVGTLAAVVMEAAGRAEGVVRWVGTVEMVAVRGVTE